MKFIKPQRHQEKLPTAAKFDLGSKPCKFLNAPLPKSNFTCDFKSIIFLTVTNNNYLAGKIFC